MDICTGLRGEAETPVTREATAAALTAEGLPVFATPYLAALMEFAACKAIHPYLSEGQTSVGTGLDIVHTAATPVGLTVRAVAEVTAVDRRAVTFRVTAYDDAGEIGSGTHTRFVVDVDRFMKSAQDKLLPQEKL